MKKCINKILLAVLIGALSISTISCGSSNVQNNSGTGDSVSPNKENPDDKLIENMKNSQISSDMVVLDYASENIAVMHSYFGLIVYNMKEHKIHRAVDLENIKMNKTQGDDYAVAVVSQDEKEIDIYSASDTSKGYRYNIENGTLDECSDLRQQENSSSIGESETLIPNIKLLKKSNQLISTNSIYLDDKTICYLTIPGDSENVSTLEINIMTLEDNNASAYNVFD